jgi:hypothetical protein
MRLPASRIFATNTRNWRVVCKWHNRNAPDPDASYTRPNDTQTAIPSKYRSSSCTVDSSIAPLAPISEYQSKTIPPHCLFPVELLSLTVRCPWLSPSRPHRPTLRHASLVVFPFCHESRVTRRLGVGGKGHIRKLCCGRTKTTKRIFKPT